MKNPNYTIADTVDHFIKKMSKVTAISPEAFEIDGKWYIDYFGSRWGMSFYFFGNTVIQHGVLLYGKDERGEWYVADSFGIDNHLCFDSAVWRINKKEIEWNLKSND